MTQEHYHFIGMGGIGMSGLARILLRCGKKVSGSDKNPSLLLKKLAAEGAEVFIGHEASQVPLKAKVVYSTDIKEENVEYAVAQKNANCLLHRSELLKVLMEGTVPLLVAGTHGKTTTSSLLTHTLVAAGLQPSYCIGGVVNNLGAQADKGEGKWFVAEADESDGSFLVYEPQGAILTNIDTDHLNYWQTKEKLIEAFEIFQKKVGQRKWLFWCADDPYLNALKLDGVSYGFSLKADLRVENVRYLPWKTVFDIHFQGNVYPDVETSLVGTHNVLNAAAVFGLALQLGIKEEILYQAMQSFLGAKRRTEKKGEARGVTVYDDYGHHPTEIATTLQGIRRATIGQRLIVLFQPHRYTRTRDCFSLFGPALAEGDKVFLTDIYGAGEEKIEGIDSQELVKSIEALGYKQFVYVSQDALLEQVLSYVEKGDVVVSMGAGDITLVGPQLLERLGV